nr:uncharacterized protein CG45076-like [Aegilops tauschii subsp. strangulata]
MIGTAEGSANTRRVEPRAELHVATERNEQEVREEWERAEKEKADAAKEVQEEADAAAKAQADATAKAQADAAAKEQAEEAAHSQTPRLIIPLNSVPPAPETQAPTGRAVDDQPVMERKGSDPVIMEEKATPPTPTVTAQTNQPKAPLSASVTIAASHTVEVSGLNQSLEQATEELGQLKRQLEDKQGAMTEVEALERVVAEDERKAAAERALRGKYEAKVIEAEQELQEVMKKCKAVERSLMEKESELTKAHQAACDAQGETQGALKEIQEARKIAAGKACSV